LARGRQYRASAAMGYYTHTVASFLAAAVRFTKLSAWWFSWQSIYFMTVHVDGKQKYEHMYF
jgi:hypothetical protein